MMRVSYCCLSIVLLCGVSAFAGTPRASVSVGEIELKTYPYSDPDPVPATDKAFYPYGRFDGFSHVATNRVWKSVVLENAKTRVTILPEIGGKVWGAVDKASGREYVYFNHVVKFRDVAMCGPWCSGGIEFNFGITGHSPTTSTPVPWLVRENADGSVSYFCGNHERILGTYWQVEVRLGADDDFFTTRVVWQNASNTPQPLYNWMTAACSARGNPEFVYPGRAEVGHPGEPHPWPVAEGGWRKDRYLGNACPDPGRFKTPCDHRSFHIVGGDTRLFGVWWPEDQFGMYHLNAEEAKVGRKLWLWGLSRQGAVWEDLLTDTDGQYVEVQSGRGFQQPGESTKRTFRYPTFAPGVTERFTERWGVVRSRDGYDRLLGGKPHDVERPLEMPKDFDWTSALGLQIRGEQAILHRQTENLGAQLLEESLAKDPYRTKTLTALGFLAYRRSQDARAAELARRALAVEAYDAEANFLDGLLALDRGDTATARERFGVASISPLVKAPALALAAKAYLKDGDAKEALRAADRALAFDEFQYEATRVKLRALSALGRTADAAAFRREVETTRPFALADDDGTPSLPVHAARMVGSPFHRRPILSAILRGDYDAAAKESIDFAFPFGRTMRRAVEAAVAARPGEWKFRYLKAVMLDASGERFAAQKLLKSCGEPTSATFWLFAAKVLDGEAALKAYDKALACGGGWRAGYGKAALLLKRGENAAAMSAAEAALKADPENGPVTRVYAKALLAVGRYEDCIDFLKSHVFLPSEVDSAIHGVWRDANLALGRLADAKSYPENLGIGKPYDQPVDTRPDEFRHANRTQDEIPPWIDFETETGWRAEAVGAGDAVAYRSDEFQLFGTNTLSVKTRNATNVLVRPAAPLALPKDRAWVGVWIRTKRGKGPISSGLKPDYGLVFVGADGARHEIPLYVRGYDKTLNWTDWHYVTHRFSDGERAVIDGAGVRFDGFYIRISKESPLRSYAFDNLAFFTRDESKKLTFTPVPDAIRPTRPEGMQPSSAGPNGRTAREGNRFVYTGDDGRLEYFWKGDLDTLEASWNGGPRFHPALGGGAVGDATARRVNGSYAPRLVGKTLVIDVTAPAGTAGVSMGRPAGARQIGRNAVPMMLDGWPRSEVVALDDGASRFFTLTFNDLYFSDASSIGKSPDATGVVNRVALYLPLTDGRFNPVRERLYVTVSPRFDDLLPVIANPPSPWRYETGSRAWCAYAGSSDRAFDKRFWKYLHGLGVRRVTIGEHEACMRDGGESFTFRDRTAPGKGGDEGMRDYADYLINTLGFRYGPYNNFTDFAPVNAEWRFDRACRATDGNLMAAWIRCYAPKPQWAYEGCLRFPPVLKRKFGFNTAYCDVHTAEFPWKYCDFDARCEGAGKFRTVRNAYAAILDEQKRVWNGPVYSEGGCQWLYAGHVDGNYGQDNHDFKKSPWIVDFDVRRLHPLEGDFGMGNLDMFAQSHPAPRRSDDPLLEAEIDRFLSATLAFGHAPYLIFETLFNVRKSHALAYPDPKAYYDPETGLPYTLRSYYMIQPVSARYALATAKEILYCDSKGVWRDISAMLLAGERFFCQVAVSYSDGTRLVVNGERARRLKAEVFGKSVDLPPLGYRVWSDDGALDVRSTDETGARADYSASPDAIFLDTRESPTDVVFPKARGRGLAVRFRDDAGWKTVVLRGNVTFTPEK